MWSQVLYHRLDSTFVTEAFGIVAPFAAHGDSFSQVTPKTYVSLEKCQKMDSDNRHIDAQAAQARCIFAASFDTVLHITNDLIKTLYEKFYIDVKTYKCKHNYRNKT